MTLRPSHLLAAALVGALLVNIGAARADPPVSWADRVQPMNQRLVNRQHLTANVPATVTVPSVVLTIGVAPNAATETLPARAVLVNVTIINPRAAGYVSAWPSGAWPGTSQLNFNRSNTLLSNLVFVEVADGGTFQVMSSTDVDVVIDLAAAFPVSEAAVVP
jgi:hypothetical protein